MALLSCFPVGREPQKTFGTIRSLVLGVPVSKNRFGRHVAYLDAGMIILDIWEMSNLRMISRRDKSPPYYGFTLTVLPLFERNLFIVTDETT